jgi:hypothetical protein
MNRYMIILCLDDQPNRSTTNIIVYEFSQLLNMVCFVIQSFKCRVMIFACFQHHFSIANKVDERLRRQIVLAVTNNGVFRSSGRAALLCDA